MAFFALILAVILETFLSTDPLDAFKARVQQFSVQFEVRFDRLGAPSLVVLQWVVPVLVWCGLAWLAHRFLNNLYSPLAGLFSLFVLVYALRFRQMAEVFTNLQLFLNQGDFYRARELYLDWHKTYGLNEPHIHNPEELMIDAVSHGAERALRQYFAPVFLFLLIPGPVLLVFYLGVLYSVTQDKARHQQLELAVEHPTMSELWAKSRIQAIANPRFVLYALEWIPTRLLGLTIGLLAQFDDTLFAWRQALLHSRFSNRAPLAAACLTAVGLSGDATRGRSDSTGGASPLMLFRRLLFRSIVVWLGLALLLAVVGLLP